VDWMIQENVEAFGDSRLLRIVLDNLLGNAWKYTSKHEIARIEFGQEKCNGTAAYFVKDDGAGFNPEYSQRLFGAFQRLHGAAEFPGTGVGLATVQRIIQRHGGRVWAEAAVEKGATFYFTL
jgi:light-regulated signal transduction histidine kinase (bacteriophytochrome)